MRRGSTQQRCTLSRSRGRVLGRPSLTAWASAVAPTCVMLDHSISERRNLTDNKQNMAARCSEAVILCRWSRAGHGATRPSLPNQGGIRGFQGHTAVFSNARPPSALVCLVCTADRRRPQHWLSCCLIVPERGRHPEAQLSFEMQHFVWCVMNIMILDHQVVLTQGTFRCPFPLQSPSPSPHTTHRHRILGVICVATPPPYGSYCDAMAPWRHGLSGLPIRLSAYVI